MANEKGFGGLLIKLFVSQDDGVNPKLYISTECKSEEDKIIEFISKYKDKRLGELAIGRIITNPDEMMKLWEDRYGTGGVDFSQHGKVRVTD